MACRVSSRDRTSSTRKMTAVALLYHREHIAIPGLRKSLLVTKKHF